MSIYATLLSLPGDFPEDPPGRVSAYALNGAQLIPRGVGGRWTHLHVANIPGFCWPVPDGGDGADTIPCAPWLRLSLGVTRADGGQDAVDVNLDIDAVRSLRDTLTEWLDTEHLPDLDADPDVTVTGADRARAALRVLRPGGGS